MAGLFCTVHIVYILCQGHFCTYVKGQFQLIFQFILGIFMHILHSICTFGRIILNIHDNDISAHVRHHKQYCANFSSHKLYMEGLIQHTYGRAVPYIHILYMEGLFQNTYSRAIPPHTVQYMEGQFLHRQYVL